MAVAPHLLLHSSDGHIPFAQEEHHSEKEIPLEADWNHPFVGWCATMKIMNGEKKILQEVIEASSDRAKGKKVAPSDRART